jgi:hypothetical protein
MLQKKSNRQFGIFLILRCIENHDASPLDSGPQSRHASPGEHSSGTQVPGSKCDQRVMGMRYFAGLTRLQGSRSSVAPEQATNRRKTCNLSCTQLAGKLVEMVQMGTFCRATLVRGNFAPGGRRLDSSPTSEFWFFETDRRQRGVHAPKQKM